MSKIFRECGLTLTELIVVVAVLSVLVVVVTHFHDKTPRADRPVIGKHVR